MSEPTYYYKKGVGWVPRCYGPEPWLVLKLKNGKVVEIFDRKPEPGERYDSWLTPNNFYDSPANYAKQFFASIYDWPVWKDERDPEDEEEEEEDIYPRRFITIVPLD